MKFSPLLLSLWFAAGAAAAVEIEDGADRVVLRNERLVLAIAKTPTPHLVSLRDRAGGVEFVAPGAGADLFELTLSKKDDAPQPVFRLASSAAKTTECRITRTAGQATLDLRFRLPGKTPVETTCAITLREHDPLVRWRLRIAAAPALVLEEVRFPIAVLRAPLEGNGEHDACAAGLTKGGVYPNPAAWPKNRGVWALQPGKLAAQFACYYTSRAGFYAAAYDARGFPKVFQARRTKAGIEWSWRHRGRHDLARPFDPGYPLVFTTFTAEGNDAMPDWRDAADIYKRWALRQPWCQQTLAARRDLPAWLRQGPAMARFSRSWLARPERLETWLNAYWKKYFPAAPLIVAFWGWEHVETWVAPPYFPPFPDDKTFARCVQAVQAAKGHVFLWPSGYHWCLTYGKRDDGSFTWDNRESFYREAAPHAVTRRDGTLLLRPCGWLRGGTNGVLCRGDPWTRKWLDDIAVKAVQHGAELIQIDQVVGAAAPGNDNCFNPKHGHPPGSGHWAIAAFHDQLASMRRACARIEPGVVLGFEEPQEWFLPQIGIQDYRDYESLRHSHIPVRRASIFAYLYHEFVPLFQSNPRAGDKRMAAYCLVTGQMPHLRPQWPCRPTIQPPNGSFEEWIGGRPADWEHVKQYRNEKWLGIPRRDETSRHSGQAALRLECRKPGEVLQISRNFPVSRENLHIGQPYRLRVWTLVDAVNPKCGIWLGAFDDRWRHKHGWKAPLEPSKNWREQVVPFSLPPGTTKLRLMLNAVGPCLFRLDDIVIETRDAAGGWSPLRAGDRPAEHDLLRQWTALYHGVGRPFLELGRMLHPPRVIRPAGAADLLTNAFRAPDGREAVIAIRAADAPLEATLRFRGRDFELRLPPWTPILKIIPPPQP